MNTARTIETRDRSRTVFEDVACLPRAAGHEVVFAAAKVALRVIGMTSERVSARSRGGQCHGRGESVGVLRHQSCRQVCQ